MWDYFHTDCKQVAWRLWFFYLAKTFSFLFKVCTIHRVPGSSVLYAMLADFVLPAATLFWTLVSDSEDQLVFKPSATSNTYYALIGIGFILPCVTLYYYFAKEEKEHL